MRLCLKTDEKFGALFMENPYRHIIFLDIHDRGVDIISYIMESFTLLLVSRRGNR
jgi:hypothetical protein